MSLILLIFLGRVRLCVLVLGSFAMEIMETGCEFPPHAENVGC
jgi:hypothetical protein